MEFAAAMNGVCVRVGMLTKTPHSLRLLVHLHLGAGAERPKVSCLESVNARVSRLH